LKITALDEIKRLRALVGEAVALSQTVTGDFWNEYVRDHCPNPKDYQCDCPVSRARRLGNELLKHFTAEDFEAAAHAAGRDVADSAAVDSPSHPARRVVRFVFDDRSEVTIEELRDRGHEFIEVPVRDRVGRERTMVIPIL
jgi:hypothetical protein